MHELSKGPLTVGLLLASLVVVFSDPGAAKNRKKRSPKPSPVSLAPFVGYWEGPGSIAKGSAYGVRYHTGQVALSVAEDSVLFEVRFGGVHRAKLRPLGLVNGAVHFEVERSESPSRSDLDIHRIEMVLHDTGTRSVEIRLESPAPAPPRTNRRRRSRRSPPPPPEKPRARFKSATLTNAQALSSRQRHYGSTGFVRYADWRSVPKGPEVAGGRLEEADRRVAEDIQRLQNDGWKCLSQIHQRIPVKGTLDLNLESSPGTPRLHLIYSRIPGPRIVYSATKQPPGYLNVSRRGHYPVVISDNGWTTRLKLTTHPAAGSLDRLPRAIPITVFIFGNKFGDYGDGCQLEEFGLEGTRQFNEYVEVLGSLALAAGMEAVRRKSIESDSALVQALATFGRNEAIEAALRRAFPDTDAEAIGYFGRWAGLLLSADISALSFFRDTAREGIVQQIQRDNPEYATKAKLVDLLVDLHLQRLESPRSRNNR